MSAATATRSVAATAPTIQVAVFAGAGSYASAQSFIAGVGPALGACAALGLLGAAAGATLHARQSVANAAVAMAEGRGEAASGATPR
jgi:hypothetical protein